MPQLAETSSKNDPLKLLPDDVWGRIADFTLPADVVALVEFQPAIYPDPHQRLTKEQLRMILIMASLDWFKSCVYITNPRFPQIFPQIRIPALILDKKGPELVADVFDQMKCLPELSPLGSPGEFVQPKLSKQVLDEILKTMKDKINLMARSPYLLSFCAAVISLTIVGLHTLYSVLFPSEPFGAVHRTAKLGNSCCIGSCLVDSCSWVYCEDLVNGLASAVSWVYERTYQISLSLAIEQCKTLISQCANREGSNDGFMELLDGSDSEYGDSGIAGICSSDAPHHTSNTVGYGALFAVVCLLSVIVDTYVLTKIYPLLASTISLLLSGFNLESLDKSGIQRISYKEYVFLYDTLFKLRTHQAEETAPTIVTGESSERPEEATPLLQNRNRTVSGAPSCLF